LDFITGPLKAQVKDDIFVGVDRLTNLESFLVITIEYNTVQRVEFFFKEIFRFHRFPHSRLSDRASESTKLPPLCEEGQLELVPEKVVEFRERRLRRRDNQESLDGGRGIPVEDATWESKSILQHPGLVFLEDKQYREGRTVISLFE
jgi:hypothetical protein